MKKIILTVVAVAALILISCEKEAYIEVENHISKVQLNEIEWGNIYIEYSLLPGESSGSTIIYPVDLPGNYPIKFKMRANKKIVYLETKEKFWLDEGESIKVYLTDTTEVVNPSN